MPGITSTVLDLYAYNAMDTTQGGFVNLALIGLLAGALTTGAWLPQLHRTWRRRSAEDISWSYLMTFGSGIVTWIVYGMSVGDVALLAANIVTLTLLAGLVLLKAFAGSRRSVVVGRSTPPDRS